jgi:hypothetical protein
LIHAKARARAAVAKEREDESKHNGKLQKEIEDVNAGNDRRISHLPFACLTRIVNR